MVWNCLLCSGLYYELVTEKVRDSGDHCVVRCDTCGHVQLHPVPTAEELAAYYAAETQRKAVHGHMTREEKQRHVQADTERRVDQISAMFPKRVLDIGCGEGFFVEALKEKGFQADGLDIGKLIRDEKDESDDKIYDVVTVFHVLEHIIKPSLSMVEWWYYVADNGYLIIEVPNQEDWLISAFQGYAAWHYQQAHIHYFTVRSLCQVINSSGIIYRSVKFFGTQRYGFDHYVGWKTFGKPCMNTPVGSISELSLSEDCAYRQLRESTLTSDTLCLILQK